MTTSTASPTWRTSTDSAVAETARLFERWQADRDPAAREALVEQFMPLARSLARRYGRSSEPLEDLVQVASVGLLKALDRYDSERGYPFQAFAVPTILGEMRRYFRDCGWSVHVPRSTQERALRVRDAQEHLTNEHGRAPTAGQIGEYLELDQDDVVDALQALQSYESISLDAPRSGGMDEDGASYGEMLGGDDESYEFVELSATLAAAMRHVPERERLILRLRYVEDLTQSEIAERVGVSQMQISRLLRRSLDQLRTLTRAPDEAL